MRRKDISLEFTNINSKLIDEAAEYRSSGKKLVRVLALAACIAVLVTAIPLALILNREYRNTEDLPAITTKDNTVIDNTEPDKEEPLVIFCSSPTELKQQLKADAKVVIKDVAERKDFSLSVDDTVVEKKNGTPYVKTITIGNETFEISYEESRASETYQSLSTHLKAYAGVDKYSTPHNDGVYWGKPTFEFSQETGKLTKYFKGTGFMKRGNLSEEELKKIADQTIYDFYGFDAASNPDYIYEVRHSIDPQDSRFDCYHLSYCRYINGYETDERISVCIDTSGQIIIIDQNLGLYDEIAETITGEKINSAIEKFTKLFSNSSTIKDDIYLSIDNYGKCSINFSTFVWNEIINNYTHYHTYIEIG